MRRYAKALASLLRSMGHCHLIMQLAERCSHLLVNDYRVALSVALSILLLRRRGTLRSLPQPYRVKRRSRESSCHVNEHCFLQLLMLSVHVHADPQTIAPSKPSAYRRRLLLSTAPHPPSHSLDLPETTQCNRSHAKKESKKASAQGNHARNITNTSNASPRHTFIASPTRPATWCRSHVPDGESQTQA